MRISQAVILAGGQGTRLRPLTLTTPKPMLSIHGKPFIAYIIELLRKNEIRDIVILVGYLHEKIEKYFGDGKRFGINISYSYSPIEADTGTRVRNALSLFSRYILLLYGDNYWPLDLRNLTEFFKTMGTAGLATVYSNFDHATKNNIFVDEKGYVRVYDRERRKKNLNGVDIGFFIFDKSIFSKLPNHNFSFEDVVLLRLIKKKQLAGFVTHHKYYGLSTHERIPVIEDYFRPKRVVFLDRDGVINKRPPKAEYVTKWDEFYFLPKAKEALKLLAQKGYEIYVVSSQAGIARRVLTRAQVDRINTRMKRELKKIGVTITDIYICPHGWDEGCFCRKPNPGLFFQAAAEHNINLYEAYCIGDDERDIIAGQKAGCKVFLVTARKTLYHVAKQLP